MRINPLAAASVLLVLTLFVASLLLNRQAGVGHSAADEVASLRHANSLLQLRVEAYEAERKQHREWYLKVIDRSPPTPWRATCVRRRPRVIARTMRRNVPRPNHVYHRENCSKKNISRKE